VYEVRTHGSGRGTRLSLITQPCPTRLFSPTFSPVNAVFPNSLPRIKPKACHFNLPHDGQILRSLSAFSAVAPQCVTSGHHSIRQYELPNRSQSSIHPQGILPGHQRWLKANWLQLGFLSLSLHSTRKYCLTNHAY